MINETEARIQQAAFIWHWNTYPEKRGLFFKIKNEGTNSISGARDKATGLIPGVADSCLLHDGIAVFIEFKTPVGVQSPRQKDWQSKVQNEGYSYFIVRTLDEFKNIIKKIYQ